MIDQITRQTEVLRPGSPGSVEADVLVENASPLICGKLEYWKAEGDYTYYHIRAEGCVWIYLTDCHGKVEAGTQYECVSGNDLKVEGCHAFGCRCNEASRNGQITGVYEKVAETAVKCRGNACGFVSSRYSNGFWYFKNKDATRDVNVTIGFWASREVLEHIGPGEERRATLQGFISPYMAEWS